MEMLFAAGQGRLWVRWDSLIAQQDVCAAWAS
jgi:hypothetical protein